MKTEFTPAFFSEIYGGVLTNPDFTPLVEKISAGAHYSIIQYDYNVRKRLDLRLFTTLLSARESYTPFDWKELFECVSSMGVYSYYHAFLSLAEHLSKRVFKTPAELQEYIGIIELEPTEGSFEFMLEQGEIWDNRKHANARVSQLFYCAKAYDYIQMVESLFRDGRDYDFLAYLQPSWDPWYLPDEFPFWNEWYNQHKAIIYGLGMAFDLFIKDTPISVPALYAKAGAPEAVIEEALKLRGRVLATMHKQE